MADNELEADPLPDFEGMYGQYLTPSTLGPRFQPVAPREGEAPMGQGDVLPSILEILLGPYHAFTRAWEAESRGERASPGDALEAALMGLHIRRMPAARAAAEPPSIVGGHPYAEHSSSDLRIMNLPAMRSADDLGQFTDRNPAGWPRNLQFPANHFDNIPGPSLTESLAPTRREMSDLDARSSRSRFEVIEGGKKD